MFHRIPSRPRKYNSNATILDVPIANQFCSSESAIEWLWLEGIGESRWGVVWTEYGCRRDQVRRCCHRCRLYADISFRSLVQSVPDASLSIPSTVGGQVFQMDVYSASLPLTQSPRPRKLSRWGGRAVLVLFGIRSGIDGVNLIFTRQGV